MHASNFINRMTEMNVNASNNYSYSIFSRHNVGHVYIRANSRSLSVI